MKNLALIGFSVVTLLISCKCKKATTDTVVSNQVPKNEVAAVQGVTDNGTVADSAAAIVQPKNEDSLKSQETVAGVEYEANSRGFYLKVKFQEGKLTYTKERDSDALQTVQLTKAQVEELNSLLNGVEAAKISELKAPTEKRFYDGAAMANIHITKSGKTYSSETFDHGIPPAQIEKLVKKLLSYVKDNE
ncbi:hypothetical protein [Flavobacterium sp. GCM10023249]|uniref:hypothetical protein n=1 Tax=unclassified Flavobacterium TaxID=196869 RepID=UPI00360BAAEF